MRRILCAWLPNFPISRLNRTVRSAVRAHQDSLPRHDTPFDRPFATVETCHGLRLLACTDAPGLRAGQKLADARAICPDLRIADADPEGDRAALIRLAGWCERYTPLAAADPPEGLWLDITGCAHLFGGEERLARDLERRLCAQNLPCRIAVTGTAGAAWALARWQAAVGAPLILPAGEERAALEMLPVASLRLETQIVGGLGRVGLKTVGDLLHIPRAELSARFGGYMLLRLDQALGSVAEAIAWPHEAPPWAERLSFAEPIAAPEDLVRALDLLARRLCARLEAKHLGGHRFTARFFRVDGETPEIAIGTALPVRDPAYLVKLLRAKLEIVDPGYGVEVASLTAENVALRATPQARLDGGQDSDISLAGVVDRLTNRLGAEHLWRATPRQTHVPERAVVKQAVLEKPPAWKCDPASPRPLRLLRQPEPIAVTALLPDEPPVMFRWRGTLHRVRAAAGPERIAREWWRHAPAVDEEEQPEADRLRDYYRVEDSEGTRFWLFRAGLNGTPNWFLHGFFG